MKFKCKKENLERIFNITERILNGRKIMNEILANIFLEAKEDKLVASSTNYEIFSKQKTNAQIEEQGSLLIPLETLSQMLKYIFDEELEFQQEGNELILKTQDHNLKIKGLPIEHYPEIKKVEGEFTCSINAKEFKIALMQIVPFCCLSEVRPELAGILFEFTPTELNLVSTDGARLGIKTLPIQCNAFLSFILVSKTIFELIKIIEDEIKEEEIDEKLEIKYNNKMAGFYFKNTEFSSMCINGSFPDWRSLIPSQVNTSIICQISRLKNSIGLAGLFASNQNKIILNIETDKLIILSSGSKVGESQTSILISCTGIPMKITLNWRYLLQGIENIRDEEIQIDLIDNKSPLVIKSLGIDKNLIYILAPTEE